MGSSWGLMVVEGVFVGDMQVGVLSTAKHRLSRGNDRLLLQISLLESPRTSWSSSPI